MAVGGDEPPSPRDALDPKAAARLQLDAEPATIAIETDVACTATLIPAAASDHDDRQEKHCPACDDHPSTFRAPVDPLTSFCSTDDDPGWPRKGARRHKRNRVSSSINSHLFRASLRLFAAIPLLRRKAEHAVQDRGLVEADDLPGVIVSGAKR
jgi:hypothetical protein